MITTNQRQPAIKARRAWQAGLLNLFGSGLGHLYCGQPLRALGVLLVSCLFPALLMLSPVQLSTLSAILVGGLLFVLWVIIDAVRWAQRTGSGYQLQWYNRWYFYLLWFLVVGFIGGFIKEQVRTHHVQAFKIPSGAMLPTLQIGDYILVDKGTYKTHEPLRGDVVVFPYPKDPQKTFIKRIVGLPGETISIQKKQVFINETALKEPYIHFSDTSGKQLPRRDMLDPVTIPTNGYFMLGDNRDQSHDSRFWGPVARSEILGQAKVVYFSWDSDASRVRWERINQTLE